MQAEAYGWACTICDAYGLRRFVVSPAKQRGGDYTEERGSCMARYGEANRVVLA